MNDYQSSQRVRRRLILQKNGRGYTSGIWPYSEKDKETETSPHDLSKGLEEEILEDKKAKI